MAVKRTMSKKKAPIKREIKRAPSKAVTNMDEEMDLDESALEPMVDATSAEQDFMEAPLTPEQQAEKDAMDGGNAAASANNATIPERKALATSAQSFKSSASYAEFMALPPEERRKLIDEDQTEQKKMKIKYNKK